VAGGYADKYPNIIVLNNEKNMKLNYTLNKCLQHAKGQYIARQDGDDESLPERLKKEVDFLDQNPEYAFVSCQQILHDENGDWGVSKLTEKPTKYSFIRESPFVHPACMIRREAFFEVEGYTDHKKLIRVEDFHLWAKLYQAGYQGYNIQEPLYRFTDNRESVSRRNFKARWNEFYVRNLIFCMLNLPFYYRFFTLKPLLVWVLPLPLYNYLHKKRLRPRDP
jgi:glycosyltransferase EpsE